VFTFGASAFYGSAAGKTDAPVTGVAGTFFGNGYTLTTSDGSVYNFGDSSFCVWREAPAPTARLWASPSIEDTGAQ